MKKTLFVVLLSLFISGSAIVKIAHAEAAQTERWVCLEAVGDWKVDNFGQTLKAKDTARPLPNTETYIVECVATAQGQICTTGRQDADQIVYKKSNLDELTATGEFKYYGMYTSSDKITDAPNPLISDANGGINNIYWRANSAHLPRKFLAMNYFTPTGDGAAGTAGALQQATFTFEQASMAKDCAAISWDPYGRVFDAQTLEPILNASVTLMFKKDNAFVKMTPSDVLGGNLINPQVTLADGGFSFVVPDGDYKLVIGAPNQLTASISEVHANYAKAYSELYPYVPADIDGVIQERGAIQHRDVPVKTVGTSTQPTMMSYFYEADTASGNSIIEGTVSHPLTKLVAHSVKVSTADPSIRTPYREIGSTIADKQGIFKLPIEQKNLESTPDYIEIFDNVEMVKVDIRTLAMKESTFMQKIAHFFEKLVPSVFAAGTSIHFEPIPQYLEGYAFSNGVAIPNATVEVYKLMSNKAYSATKADAKGYFKITSEFLPRDPYELRYVTATGTVVKTTTSQFIATNQKTIVANKINVYGYRDQKNKTIADLVKPTKAIANTNGGRNTNMTGTNNQTTGQNNSTQSPIVNALGQNIGILIAIAALVIIGAVVAVVMMKKKAPPVDGMVQ